jgi:hypothetical protein
LGQRRGLKNPCAGEEDGFLVHPQNGLNGLIQNWCTGGCWFTPALFGALMDKNLKVESHGQSELTATNAPVGRYVHWMGCVFSFGVEWGSSQSISFCC